MNEYETQQRDEVERLNRQRLVNLMLKHGITIPARDFDKWRPTDEKTGRIEGVSDGLTCIMTNGVLGYFLREDREPLYGHMAWFKWDVAEVSFVPYINEAGELRYFKQVKDQGTPSAFYRMPAKPRPMREKKPKKPRAVISTKQAVSVVDKLIAKYNIK